jgi:tRNA threonylcarbamoyladenosine biosynthesis protein TsaE
MSGRAQAQARSESRPPVEVHRSTSEEETRALGERLARTLTGGEVVLLCGDLGAGKTVFAKGVARGLGVEAEVVSPTFTMAVRYEGRLPLVHYDLYRVRGARELEELGFLAGDDAREVALVEWGDRAEPPRSRLEVRIAIEPTGARRIEIESFGRREAT